MHGYAGWSASGGAPLVVGVELCVYVDDVDGVFRQARAGGFEPVAEPADMPWGERTAWIADPDGNLVMLTR